MDDSEELVCESLPSVRSLMHSNVLTEENVLPELLQDGGGGRKTENIENHTKILRTVGTACSPSCS